MNARDICGVVITFRPASAVLENLAKLRLQVGSVAVVDNGSPAESLAPLRQAAAAGELTLLENGANVGIAAALNTGIRWARDRGFGFVALFDQDSAVTEGFMQAMIAAYQAHPQREKVALVTPSQVERGTHQARGQWSMKDGSPLVAITSGSLMPVEIFAKCGWFQEELIIDCVDHEFCLRARSLGYTLAECREAVLFVAVGAIARHRAFGITIHARHYSARRRYYMTRNRVVMIHRYWREQPAWCLRTLQDIVQDAVKSALVEDERWSKIRLTGRGIYDAFCGRMGKVIEL